MWRWSWQAAGQEGTKNAIFTLVLLNDPRSRCHGEASSHPKNTRLAPACNNKIHSNENFSPSLVAPLHRTPASVMVISVALKSKTVGAANPQKTQAFLFRSSKVSPSLPPPFLNDRCNAARAAGSHPLLHYPSSVTNNSAS